MFLFIATQFLKKFERAKRKSILFHKNFLLKNPFNNFKYKLIPFNYLTVTDFAKDLG